jgi:hypothetical protein
MLWVIIEASELLTKNHFDTGACTVTQVMGAALEVFKVITQIADANIILWT